ncbi:hypothetical protein G7K_0779-t1 [Saitoella complicata NRRL Y-17804]|uniref:Secreted protein n=1 Tax=Saitoella complicata (strain BCRC 22490 / CBS 7301 / JCM 7358 / NBRC 10748 / NRRL Y-17804) TaxID=698492 RepID=A0A0E9N9P7_SAICN|nr:hypothetical protein G7K_0779-t1 [Saitoella complicata NRRL Y-17804]
MFSRIWGVYWCFRTFWGTVRARVYRCYSTIRMPVDRAATFDEDACTANEQKFRKTLVGPYHIGGFYTFCEHESVNQLGWNPLSDSIANANSDRSHERQCL